MNVRLMSALYPSINITFAAMSSAETQIHDDAVGDGHEMGEKRNIIGNGEDEDMVDDEIKEKHNIIGEMGGVNIG